MPKRNKYSRSAIWLILGAFLIVLITLFIISTSSKIEQIEKEKEIKDLLASITARGDLADSVVHKVKEKCMPYEMAFERLDSLESQIDEFELKLRELKSSERVDINASISTTGMKLQVAREEVLSEMAKEEFGEKEISQSCAFLRELWLEGLKD